MECPSGRRGCGRSRGREGEVVQFPEAIAASLRLRPHLKPGLQAVKESAILILSKEHSYTGSVDVDAAYQPSEPNAKRWDYAIGIARRENKDVVVWIEPHTASSGSNVDEIATKFSWLVVTMRRDATSLTAMEEHLFLWLVKSGVSPHVVRGSRATEELGVRVKAAGKVTVDEMMNWPSHRFPKR